MAKYAGKYKAKPGEIGFFLGEWEGGHSLCIPFNKENTKFVCNVTADSTGLCFIYGPKGFHSKRISDGWKGEGNVPAASFEELAGSVSTALEAKSKTIPDGSALMPEDADTIIAELLPTGWARDPEADRV